MNTDNENRSTRREFITSGVAAAAVGALAAPLILSSPARAYAPTDKIRVGLIGCGGRGSGAASQALAADPGVILVAMGDVFKEKIDASMSALKAIPEIASRVQVKPDHCFIGLNAYQKVIDSGVDVVLLASPPGFHPGHIKAAIAGNKHVFAEKPMGSDAVGVLEALEATKLAKEKKLTFVAGFCFRYNLELRAFYKRIQAGAIGKVRNVHATYLTGPVKAMPAESSRPAGMSDVEWQIRNWYNFVWLSGDGLVEQACHSVDKILWAMNDVPPLKCVATGGRVYPNAGGNIFDHIDVFYEWADGTRATMAQRQIPTPVFDNSDYIAGATGMGIIKQWVPEITGATNWKYEGPKKDMYQIEHDELFASIRKGTPINDGERMARSTLVGLMGRMAAYTGAEITWEQMLHSKEKLVPDNLAWNSKLAVPPMAMPGITKYI